MTFQDALPGAHVAEVSTVSFSVQTSSAFQVGAGVNVKGARGCRRGRVQWFAVTCTAAHADDAAAAATQSGGVHRTSGPVAEAAVT